MAISFEEFVERMDVKYNKKVAAVAEKKHYKAIYAQEKEKKDAEEKRLRRLDKLREKERIAEIAAKLKVAEAEEAEEAEEDAWRSAAWRDRDRLIIEGKARMEEFVFMFILEGKK